MDEARHEDEDLQALVNGEGVRLELRTPWPAALNLSSLPTTEATTKSSDCVQSGLPDPGCDEGDFKNEYPGRKWFLPWIVVVNKSPCGKCNFEYSRELPRANERGMIIEPPAPSPRFTVVRQKFATTGRGANPQ